MKTTQYLDAAKRALNIESDYALAAHLALTKQAISKLRQGRLVMSNTTAAKIAHILDVPAIRVIADAELERGTNDTLWKRLRDAAVLAAMAIGAATLGFNNNSFASNSALRLSAAWDSPDAGTGSGARPGGDTGPARRAGDRNTHCAVDGRSERD
jgi:hypothetical protein